MGGQTWQSIESSNTSKDRGLTHVVRKDQKNEEERRNQSSLTNGPQKNSFST